MPIATPKQKGQKGQKKKKKKFRQNHLAIPREHCIRQLNNRHYIIVIMKRQGEIMLRWFPGW